MSVSLTAYPLSAGLQPCHATEPTIGLGPIELNGIDHITPRRMSPYPALQVVIPNAFRT
jgi:hypothetical protein